MSEAIDPKILNISQKISWILIRPFLKFFTGYKACILCEVNEIKSPLIIASNHVSFLDPPILGTILPINCPAYPAYFITKDKYMSVPVLGSFLKFFGAFQAWRGEGHEKSLAEPKKILQSGCSVVFFPEGGIRKGLLGKPGTAVLALATNKPILPVAICGFENFSWPSFFLRKHRVKVMVGKPFLLKDKLTEFYAPDNIEVGTQIIMEEIKKLLEQNSNNQPTSSKQ